MSKILMTVSAAALAFCLSACEKSAPPVAAPKPPPAQPAPAPAPEPEAEVVIDTARLAEEARVAITADNAEAVAAELAAELEAELAAADE